MTRPRIVLDCDPGIDDAFAIFCALRYAELVAVTTVAGNVPLEHTTRNAGYVLELAGRGSVPVHPGAPVPLEVEPLSAARVHGAAGLGDVVTPPPATPSATEPAREAIVRLAAAEPLTIVATGPLTNVAEALDGEPALADRLDRILWMGGSTAGGNVTEHAEFNAWADPHAADRVFRSGVPLTMFGLNLTRGVRMGAQHSDMLRRADTATSRPAAAYLDFYERRAAEPGVGQPMHDPCAVLGLTHPDLFVFEGANSLVVTSGEMRGRTLITEAPTADSSTITVATSADVDRVIGAIMAATTHPGGLGAR